MIQGKYLIDYETLFINHDILTGFHDCALIIPFSSFVLFQDMVKEGYESDIYNEKEKKEFLEYYTPFLNVATSNIEVIDEIREQKKKMSSAFCISKQDNLYLAFGGSFRNEELKFSRETLKDLDTFDYDIFSCCKTFNIPLFTTTDRLIAIIERDRLGIKYIKATVDDEE